MRDHSDRPFEALVVFVCFFGAALCVLLGALFG